MTQGGILRVSAFARPVGRKATGRAGGLPFSRPPLRTAAPSEAGDAAFPMVFTASGGPCLDTRRECGLAEDESGHEDPMESM